MPFVRIVTYILMGLFMLAPAQSADLKKIQTDISDSVITTKIKTKITQNVNLNPLKISVSTEQGLVTLQGYVKNKEAFVELLRLTKETSGVKDIDSEGLEIKRVNTIFTDAYITTKVEAAILKAKVIHDESIPLVGINVSTSNGVVTISGEVKHQKSILVIVKSVYGVRGVKKIISDLKVTQHD